MNEIFAIGTPEPNNAVKNLVWAFDTSTQYTIAIHHLNASDVPHIPYHRVGLDYEPLPSTAWRLSNAKWIELSEGINDADEVLNWIKAHDMEHQG